MTTKRCRLCGEDKPLDEFGPDKKSGDRHEYRCRDCNRNRAQEHRKANPQRTLEINRKSYQKLSDKRCAEARQYAKDHPDRIKQARRNYVQGHRDKINSSRRVWTASNRELANERRKRYERRHPESVTRKNAVRRSRAAGLPSTLTKKQWSATLKRFGFKCAYCGGSPQELQADHFIPLTRGGGFTWGNMVPACVHCNSSKYNTDPLEWLVSKEHGLVTYAIVFDYLQGLSQ